MPKKVKYRKLQRGGEIKGNANKGARVSFGLYGLKAVEIGMLTSKEIEAARRAMTRFVQRGGKIWIRIFPDHSMTKKGQETPMGKGKGLPDYFMAKIKPGRVIFEIEGVDEKTAKEAFRLGANKLSVKTRFIKAD